MLRGAWTICQRELNAYFSSPIAYAVMALYAVIFGFFFYSATAYFVEASMQSQMQGRSFPMNINEMIIRPVLLNTSVIGLFLIPMITMRLFAEEKRSGTIELLVTSPISDVAIIVGKWLSAVILYGAVQAVASLSILYLFAWGKPDWKPIAIGYLGMLLQGAALLAIGTFISTTTRNQIIAGTAGFVISLLLWVIEWVSQFDTSTTGKVISYLSVVTHLEPFTKGVIDLRDVVFFVSLTFLGLFLSARSLESLRWRA
jgi:ABC-2 type transport system permease protein